MNSYLQKYFLCLGCTILITVIPIWYLHSVGEYMPLTQVVNNQHKSINKLIYGTALHDNTHEYKKLLLQKSHKPSIIALGSSRVMQFRQRAFTKDFVNLGGAMGSINEGSNLLQEIINSKPDVVLIGADLWWFNDRYHKPDVKYIPRSDSNNPEIHLRDVQKVFIWLYEGKITLKDISHAISSGTTDIGVSGQAKDGFSVDGSYYYTRLITGKKEHHDKRFKSTLKRINDGQDRFKYSLSASNQHITNFLQIVRLLEENNIKVIVFFPPFAKSVHGLLSSKGDKYQYINDLKDKLLEEKLRFFDYTDPSTIDSSDCEFIDGFHGGGVTYIRILKDLALRVPFLNNFVNQALLMEYINKYEGNTFIPDEAITSLNELDFLDIGCKK